MNISVRKFEPKDAETLSQIQLDSFKTFLGDRITEMVPSEEWCKVAAVKNEKAENAIFVAEQNGSVVGFISASADLRRGLGVLNVIGVDPECHAKGIGSALFEAAEKFWTDRKMRKVWTCVSSINPKAQIYYLKQGFTPEGRWRDHFFDGIDEILLAKFYRQPNPS
ncbi:MAG: GNAT family N-acetyltransferase [Victivallaceae bacterium]|jgi:ribosomal protein S18 acetylase RimI-like enzyme|nr:GNAT family N-acetyltransferase [Victivallaceae bacterium]NLK83642.1 GNAT family N-acetyltransferase [Lentisphaerota bacterium]MDD3116480.1 GNAT family N-acetyltransferase [Victivallaceae bacterium]MDD3702993.1 GNAT family N-acetyltransferase [Victivallaceae bacterium]MDD4317244.1 GNAT family N-acetyltransferase [Victivallaceae bacterium]